MPVLGPILRAFCAKGHDRELMASNQELQRFECRVCGQQITHEKVYHDIPRQYRVFFDTDFGALAADLMDIAAIDLIYENFFMPIIEQPRVKDLQ